MCQLGVRAISTYSRYSLKKISLSLTERNVQHISAHTQGSLSKKSLSQSAMFSGGEIVSLDRELTGIVFAINLHPAGGQVCFLSSFTTLSSSSASIQQVVNRFSFWWSFTWLNLKDVGGRLVIQDFWQTCERDFFQELFKARLKESQRRKHVSVNK